jgi:hypothetical protein
MWLCMASKRSCTLGPAATLQLPCLHAQLQRPLSVRVHALPRPAHIPCVVVCHPAREQLMFTCCAGMYCVHASVPGPPYAGCSWQHTAAAGPLWLLREVQLSQSQQPMTKAAAVAQACWCCVVCQEMSLYSDSATAASSNNCGCLIQATSGAFHAAQSFIHVARPEGLWLLPFMTHACEHMVEGLRCGVVRGVTWLMSWFGQRLAGCEPI